MQQYSALAEVYDKIQEDELYFTYANYIKRLFEKHKQAPHLLLELACGTGTLSYLLSEMGYEMISTDISPDMLSIAQEKCRLLSCPPVFICQDMCELDLYGTVDAAVCTLDSINYITGIADLKITFLLVKMFLNPNGLFIFDVKSRAMFDEMAGDISIYDNEDTYAIWQYGRCAKNGRCTHIVDIFNRSGGKFDRYSEEHMQRAYSRAELTALLEQCGFKVKAVYRDFKLRSTAEDNGRLFFVAQAH